MRLANRQFTHSFLGSFLLTGILATGACAVHVGNPPSKPKPPGVVEPELSIVEGKVRPGIAIQQANITVYGFPTEVSREMELADQLIVLGTDVTDEEGNFRLEIDAKIYNAADSIYIEAEGGFFLSPVTDETYTIEDDEPLVAFASNAETTIVVDFEQTNISEVVLTDWTESESSLNELIETVTDESTGDIVPVYAESHVELSPSELEVANPLAIESAAERYLIINDFVEASLLSDAEDGLLDGYNGDEAVESGGGLLLDQILFRAPHLGKCGVDGDLILGVETGVVSGITPEQARGFLIQSPLFHYRNLWSEADLRQIAADREKRDCPLSPALLTEEELAALE